MLYFVQATVHLDVETEEDFTKGTIAKTFREAVQTALNNAQSNGFDHTLANTASIVVDDLSIISVIPEEL